MPTRPRAKQPTNVEADQRKNVHDPAAHPLGRATSPEATARRKEPARETNARLPHEHDETADVQERAAGTDAVIEQAREDAESGQIDTERRGEAVKVFRRAKRHTSRRR